MKKWIGLVMSMILLGGAVLSMAGCDTREKLYVYNCGDYIGEDVIAKFEKAYPHIKVVYDVFDTNEIMYQRLISSGIAYDVLIPSDYMIERLIKEDRLLKIDMSRLNNLSKIDPDFLGSAFDPNQEYAVPYMWGTLGIMYNTQKVTEEVDSWNILWDEKYDHQILMLDSMRDTLGLSLKRLGYSMNTTDENEINEARDALIEQSKLVADYGMDTLKEPMIKGLYALSVAYSGDAYWMIQENEDLAFAVPKEGSNVWTDAMVIPNTSKNTDAAYLFIDFMCSTEIAFDNADYIGYSTPQTEALAMLDQKMREDPVYNPPKEVLERCEYFHDLGDKLSLYNDAWEKFRLAGA